MPSSAVGVCGLPVLSGVQGPATAQAPGPGVAMMPVGSQGGTMAPSSGRHLLQSAEVPFRGSWAFLGRSEFLDR